MSEFNRRHFLMTAGLAAHSAFAQTASQRVGTAVIGTGNRGSYLLQGVLEHPEAKVTAVCDIKPDRLDKAATLAARDNPKALRDWRQVLERSDVEAVYIATPPHLHAEMAIAALKAGKHVYCEKPIGITPASVRDLVKAARSTSKVFQAGQQMRSYRQIGEAIRKIREGAIGDILMVKAQRHQGADLPHDGPSGDWYFDVKKSGGYLIEMSVHNLDVCNWVIGSHPVKASGFGGIALYKNDPPGRTIFDHGSITFEYANGIKMSFTQNVFHPRGLPAGGQYVYVYGSKGAVDLLGGTTFYPLDSKGEPKELAPKQEEPRHAHITAFYSAILKGTPSPADITVGATAALTAILGHEAMSKGRVVTWSELGVEL